MEFRIHFWVKYLIAKKLPIVFLVHLILENILNSAISV